MVRSKLGAVRRAQLLASVLTLLAVPLSAQVVEKGRTYADLVATHPCNSGSSGRLARVTDAQSSSSIGGGGGSTQVWAVCDGVDTWTLTSIGSAGGGAATAVTGSATLPATCTEKDLYQDTDSGGTEFYVCTAANTWTKTGTGTGDAVGPASSTDNAIARFDSTTGKLLQDSTVTVADSTGNLQWEGTTADAFEGNFTFADPTADWTWAWGAAGDLVGAGSLSIDNLKLDGNTLSSTNTDGNVVIDPNGSGLIDLSSAVTLQGQSRFTAAAANTMLFGPVDASAYYFRFDMNPGNDPALRLGTELPINWGASGVLSASDTGISRLGSGVLGVGNGVLSDFSGTIKAASYIVGATSGGMSTETYSTELLTLSTGGATTATAANLAPASSVIEAILYRVTTSITASCTAFTVKVTGGNAFVNIGTATTSQGTVTANTTGVLVPAAYADQFNAAAATLTVTCNGTPGAGVVRLTTVTKTLTPSTL